MNRLSLRLALGTLAVVTAMFLIFGLGVYASARQVLVSDASHTATDSALRLSRLIEGSAGQQLDPSDIGLFAGSPNIIALVFNQRGRVINRSAGARALFGAHGRAPQRARADYASAQAAYQIGRERGHLQVWVSLAATMRLLRELRAGLLGLGGFALLLALLATALTTRLALAPIRSLARRVRQLDIRSGDARVPPGEGELGTLSEAINDLLSRLEQAQASQRNLIADASHALRTPLAIVSGYLDMLARWGDRDEALYDEAMAKVRAELGRMAHTVNQLLALSTIDRQSPAPAAPLPLLPLLSELVENMRAASNRQMHLEVRGAPTVVGQAGDLQRIFTALLENALKYAPQGPIEVRALRQAKSVIVEVQDHGPGIAPDQLPRIFDRFYRAQPGGTATGSGLGLSIARGTAERLGGTIEVHSSPGQGARFRVILPAAKPLSSSNV